MPLITSLGLQPIHTSYNPKPGPFHLAYHLDWEATFDSYEPGDPIGYGPTERDAVVDLLNQHEEDLLDQLPQHAQFPELHL